QTQEHWLNPVLPKPKSPGTKAVHGAHPHRAPASHCYDGRCRSRSAALALSCQALTVDGSRSEATTRPTRTRAGAGNGASEARPARVVASEDWSRCEALEMTWQGMSGEKPASRSHCETSLY